MDWTIAFNMIDAKLFLVVAVCWIVGYILKQTPKVPDWTIIYIVTLFAIIFTVWMLGVTSYAILQGVLCGAVAVYGHQLVRQVQKAGEDDANTKQ